MLPRKKACQQCSHAKSRCNLRRPTCARCELRGLRCQYIVKAFGDASSSNGTHSLAGFSFTEESATDGSATLSTSAASLGYGDGHGAISDRSGSVTAVAVPTQSLPTAGSRGTASSEECCHQESTSRGLDFAEVDLVPSAEWARISNHWLNTLLPSPSQKPKELSANTVHYISCVLKTYPRMMIRTGCLPPIIHPSQVAGGKVPVPLANCMSLVRMWEGRAPGSEAMVTEAVRREMERLFQAVCAILAQH